MLYFDPRYFWFFIPALLLSLYAQWKVSSTYQRYAQVPNARGLTGADTARILIQNEGLEYVRAEPVAGFLTDYYDPRTKSIHLSQASYQTPSIAAMAVVAHELGHAQQDKQGYVWLRARSGIAGIAAIGSNLGWIVLFIGIMLGAFAGSPVGYSIAWVGVLLMSAAVAFSLITLPVEFNASARAREMLQRNGLVTPQEAQGVKAVLDAAALTYVAAAAQAVLQLLYWISALAGANRRN